MLLVLTICFVTPSHFSFCQKIIFFYFFEIGLTSLPPFWTMSLNILFFLGGVPLTLHLILKISCISSCLIFKYLRGTPPKKTVYLKTLSKREGGRSTQFQKNKKKNDFLTKGEEGGSHKHIVKNINSLFCRIYYSIWSNQFQTNCGKCPLLFYEGFLYA